MPGISALDADERLQGATVLEVGIYTDQEVWDESAWVSGLIVLAEDGRTYAVQGGPERRPIPAAPDYVEMSLKVTEIKFPHDSPQPRIDGQPDEDLWRREWLRRFNGLS